MGSIMDALGTMFGNLAAQAEEAQKFKSEYERFSDRDLIREYQKLKQQNGSRERLMAVSSVLSDRGLIK